MAARRRVTKQHLYDVYLVSGRYRDEDGYLDPSELDAWLNVAIALVAASSKAEAIKVALDRAQMGTLSWEGPGIPRGAKVKVFSVEDLGPAEAHER